MEQPVTRRELREELASYPTKAELREELASYPTKADLREALASYPTKVDLREELARYPTKVDLREELAKLKTEFREEFATKVELQSMTKLLLREMTTMFTTLRADMATMRSDMAAMRVELHGELAQHTRAIEESTRAHIAVLDDKYADLPGRVAALEAERDRR